MEYARKEVEKTKKIAKKFVRYQEGAELYSIGVIQSLIELKNNLAAKGRYTDAGGFFYFKKFFEKFSEKQRFWVCISYPLCPNE